MTSYRLSIGFTGSRHGMTTAQREAVVRWLCASPPSVVHHGDCLGADAQFHEIVRTMGRIRIVGHPPLDPKLRAFCECDELREPAEYLVRDKAIVRESRILIATPFTAHRFRRSGTWTTIGYAEQAGIEVIGWAPTGEPLALARAHAGRATR